MFVFNVRYACSRVFIVVFCDKAVKDILVPKLPTYLDQLSTILNDPSASNAFRRSDAQHILGALTVSNDLMMCNCYAVHKRYLDAKLKEQNIFLHMLLSCAVQAQLFIPVLLRKEKKKKFELRFTRIVIV